MNARHLLKSFARQELNFDIRMRFNPPVRVNTRNHFECDRRSERMSVIAQPRAAFPSWRNLTLINRCSGILWCSFLLAVFTTQDAHAQRAGSAEGQFRRHGAEGVTKDSPTSPVSKNEALPFDGDARLVIHRDVIYGRTHPDIQKLDAYLVKATRPTPVVIEIHGGGWRRGSKSQFVYQSDLIGAIIDAGMSVISIDYRLSPQHVFPAQTDDAARAVQFVR